MSYMMIWQRKKCIIAGNHEYKKTDGTNSVQSSLKAQPSWVTLYNSEIFSQNVLTNLNTINQ